MFLFYFKFIIILIELLLHFDTNSFLWYNYSKLICFIECTSCVDLILVYIFLFLRCFSTKTPPNLPIVERYLILWVKNLKRKNKQILLL